MRRFCWFELRTTDVEGAAAFYGAVAGVPRAAIVPLPEPARARGAPAHWLGHVAVDDLDATLRAWTAHGGEAIGPRVNGVQVVRDPQGAVLAIRAGAPRAPLVTMLWHDLATTDRVAAIATYAAVFGWRAREVSELPPPVGTYQRFAWDDDGPAVGGMADTARTPGIHTHWLHHLAVPDLDAALAAALARGGERIDSRPGFAVCHDPQGAIFSIKQAA